MRLTKGLLFLNAALLVQKACYAWVMVAAISLISADSHTFDSSCQIGCRTISQFSSRQRNMINKMN